MAEDVRKELTQTGRLASLWTGLLLAPVAWICQLQASYLLVFYACSSRHIFTLHVATLVFLLAAAIGGFIAWRNWERVGRELPSEDAGPVPRTRFMALLGLLTSALFFLLILVQGLPSFFLEPCIK